jgi:hypothetical protein
MVRASSRRLMHWADKIVWPFLGIIGLTGTAFTFAGVWG